VFAPLGSDFVALISGFDDDESTGGLFEFDGKRVARLDELPSTGLAVQNGSLARVLRGRDDDPRATFLRYDEEGVRSNEAIEGLVDPHDILWVGDAYAIACAGANRIVFVSAQGEVTRVWEALGARDAWHLNSLLLVDGELHVCAFGKFTRHREWAESDASSTGLILNVETRQEVLTGLCFPHHPRLVDGEWLVCNSGRRELTRIGRDGGVTAQLVLEGWTRGLAVLDSLLLVGESPGRTEPPGVSGTVAIVDRVTWKVVDRLQVPAREIYDVVIAPRWLADVVRHSARRPRGRGRLGWLPKLGASLT
jgi:hypothetical protein